MTASVMKGKHVNRNNYVLEIKTYTRILEYLIKK